MPIELERQLRAEAKQKGLKGKEFDAYVYGGLRNAGWAPAREHKKKVN